MVVPSAILTGAFLLLHIGDSNQQDSVIQFGLNDASFKTGKTGYLSVVLNKTVTEDGQWYKDGTLLSRIPNKLLLLSTVDQGVRQMVLYNIQLVDTGQYTYTVMGESTSAYLTVTGSGIVDGGWSEWTEWFTVNNCPATCGTTATATKTRNRRCDNPTPQNGGLDCTGSPGQTLQTQCGSQDCPTGGSVIAVGLHGLSLPAGSQAAFRVTLSKTGITGTWYKNGIRLFNSGRLTITGAEALQQNLNIYRLQQSDSGLYTFTVSGESTSGYLSVTGQGTVNGGWSNWGPWSSSVCSVTCGTTTGLRTRNRTCTNPRPQNGGADCQGSSIEYMTDSCVRPRCPIDGGWSQWSQWGNRVCPQTCGTSVIGNRTRSRYCNNPYPQYGGATCVGLQTETATAECALSACPASVFLLGLQDITQPEGSQVVLRVILAQATNIGIWYKDGYGIIGSDRVYATGGGKLQILLINNLQSSDAGLYTFTINGETTNATLTVTGQGTVNGGWSNWGSWSSSVCSVTCGTTTGLRTRNRTCTNPRPQNGGADCQGSSIETMNDSCVRPRCPIDGGWSQWSQWGNRVCPQTCGTSVIGNRTRSRYCNNPYPQYGGAICVGPQTQTATAECALSACPDPGSGTWNNWSSWSRSTCSVTCGSRDIQTLTRNRTCVTDGGRGQCVGGNVQTDYTACGPLVCPTITPPTSRSHKSQQHSSLLISGCLTIVMMYLIVYKISF